MGDRDNQVHPELQAIMQDISTAYYQTNDEYVRNAALGAVFGEPYNKGTGEIDARTDANPDGVPETINTAYYRTLFNEAIAEHYELVSTTQGRAPTLEEWDSRLTRWSMELATLNARMGTGGPFGALMVRYDDQGLPQVIGVGANHVFPNSDPSAHAEMELYRDTFAYLRDEEGVTSSKFSDYTMYTSCECCPMCLSSSHRFEVGRIVYGSTREHAAYGEFADDAQYDLMEGELEDQAMMLDGYTARTAEAEVVLQRLGEIEVSMLEGGDLYNDGVEAVVINSNGDIVGRGYNVERALLDHPETADPTNLPTMQAVRDACKATGSFELGEDYTVLSLRKPHPASLITADWAQIGRKNQGAEVKTGEALSKDPSKILYINDEWEQPLVRQADGTITTLHSAEDTWSIFKDAEKVKHVSNSLIADSVLMQVFERWLVQRAEGEAQAY